MMTRWIKMISLQSKMVLDQKSRVDDASRGLRSFLVAAELMPAAAAILAVGQAAL